MNNKIDEVKNRIEGIPRHAEDINEQIELLRELGLGEDKDKKKHQRIWNIEDKAHSIRWYAKESLNVLGKMESKEVWISKDDLEDYRLKEADSYNIKVYKLPIKINDRRYLIEKLHDLSTSSYALAEDLDGGAEHQYYTCGLWIDYRHTEDDINLLDQTREFRFT